MKTKAEKAQSAAIFGATIGHVGGLVYAFQKKKKFWGYVGHFLLFGIVAGTTAWIGAQVILPKDEDKNGE